MSPSLEDICIQALTSPLEELPERLREILKRTKEIQECPTFSSTTSELVWMLCCDLLFQRQERCFTSMRMLSSSIEESPSQHTLLAQNVEEMIRQSMRIFEDLLHHSYEEVTARVRSFLNLSQMPSLPLFSPSSSFLGWSHSGPKNASSHLVWIDEWTLIHLQHLEGIAKPILIFPRLTTFLHAFSIPGSWFKQWTNQQLAVLVLDRPLCFQCEEQNLFFDRRSPLGLVTPKQDSFWWGPSSIWDMLQQDIFDQSLQETVESLKKRIHALQERLIRILPERKHSFFAMLEENNSEYKHEQSIFQNSTFCTVLWKTKPKKKPLFIEKEMPRIIHIVDQLDDERSHVLLKLLEFRNKKNYATAIVSLELKLSLSQAGRQKKSNSLKSRKTIQFLQEKKIGYALANSQLELDQSIEEIIDRTMNASPDLLVFHGMNPIHLSLAHQIQDTKKMLITESIVEGLTLPFDRIVAAFGAKKEGRYILTPPPPQRGIFWKQSNLLNNFSYPIPFSFLAATYIHDPRLSCCLAFRNILEKILETCPRLHLAIFGSPSKDQLSRFFDWKKWGDRVFIPKKEEEKQALLIQTNLYLNPFPIGSQEEVFPFLMQSCPIITLSINAPWHTREKAAQQWAEEQTIAYSSADYIRIVQELYQNPKKLFMISQRSLLKSVTFSDSAWYVLHVEKEMQSLCNI